MQNAKCKMRTWKEIVIAAQSTYWCGPFQGFPPVTIPRFFRPLPQVHVIANQ